MSLSCKYFQCIFFLLLYVVPKMAYYSHTRIFRNTETGCFLLSNPKNGRWLFVDSSGNKKAPRMVTPSGQFLSLTCNDGYKVEGDAYVNCIGNNWTRGVGKCLKKCLPLYNTPHLQVICRDKNKKNVSCSEVVDEYSAEFRCDRFYETRNVETGTTIYCYNGQWNSKIPECIFACGQNKFSQPATAIGAKMATKDAYPWQAAIYNRTDKQFMCGGSLISPRAIVTAAHCITKDIKDFSKDAFLIAVRKYYVQYNHTEDKYAQFSSVEEIYFDDYEGEAGNYKNDIAIVITTLNFTLSDEVRPICVDFSSNVLKKAIETKRDGYVIGWGFTEESSGRPSVQLNELRVPFINKTSCSNHLPSHWRKYLTDDKLCAGYLNNSKAVCKGDSGSGLFFKDNDKFSLTAIVSVAPTSSSVNNKYSCDSQKYGLYTNISYHKLFVGKVLAQLRIPGAKDSVSHVEEPVVPFSQSDCLLPEYPQFGNWSVDNNSEYGLFPGQMVKSGTRLATNCQNQHVLDGSKYVVCEKGRWNSTLGICLKTCPNIYKTKTMNVECIFEGPGLITLSKQCVNATDGTLAEFQCIPFYEDFAITINPVHVCVNGKWDQTTPVCSPACGQLFNDSTGKKFFPWHVGIYNSINKQLICSGSLINERVVVTAAHCVTDAALNLKPESSFLLTAGAHYRTFNDNRDSKHVQISEVEHIFLPYSSHQLKPEGLYHQDIAILIAKKSFVLTERILPVCLNKSQNFAVFEDNDDSKNDTSATMPNFTAYVSGWGYNIDKNDSPEQLKIIEVPSNATTDCPFEKLSENYILNFILDKRCSRPIHSGSMICYGDTGAGLVTQAQDKRYYLDGVVSISPTTPVSIGVCNRQEFNVYTLTYFYIRGFILKREAEFRPSYTDL